MTILDLEALERTSAQHDPCDFVIVPRFVRADQLAAVNRDFPAIEEAGNFDPAQLEYGPSIQSLIDELNSPEVKAAFSRKFDVDLDGLTLQMTFRKYSKLADGNAHNDSKNKIVTALIYFNEDWPHDSGRLRMLRSTWNMDDYAAEVAPQDGNLIAFKRNEQSYHGFNRYEGERRSLQMYWVKPKRQATSKREKGFSLKRSIKRLLRWRPRFG